LPDAQPIIEVKPGQLRLAIPPLRPRDLPGQGGFIASCLLIATGVFVNIFAVRYRVFIPGMMVLLLLLLSVAALVTNQLLAHISLSVEGRELVRDMRTPILGRRVSRYNAADIRDVVVVEQPLRVVLQFKEQQKTIGYVRTKEQAEELARELRAALHLTRYRDV
jgi:hypothetical protein